MDMDTYQQHVIDEEIEGSWPRPLYDVLADLVGWPLVDGCVYADVEALLDLLPKHRGAPLLFLDFCDSTDTRLIFLVGRFPQIRGALPMRPYTLEVSRRLTGLEIRCDPQDVEVNGAPEPGTVATMLRESLLLEISERRRLAVADRSAGAPSDGSSPSPTQA